MAEDIFGISGQMDIADIENSFQQLISNLDQLGVKTNEISSRMTKALNDIAQSSDSDSTKIQQSLQVLRNGLSDINNTISSTPELLKKLSSESNSAEFAVAKLQKQLTNTQEGSAKWQEINNQLTTQKKLASQLSEEYNGLFASYSTAQQYIGVLSAGIETLNAGRTISATATATSALSHTAAAAAVVGEAAAHVDNAESIEKETQKLRENDVAVQQIADSTKQHNETLTEEAQMLGRLTDQMKDGKISEEQYKNIIEQETDSLEKQKAIFQELSQKKDDYNSHPLGSGITLDSEGNITNDNYLEKRKAEIAEVNRQYDEQKKIVNQSQTALDSFIAAHDSLTNSQENVVAVSQKTLDIGSQEIEQTNKEIDAIKDKEATLKLYQEQLEQMQTSHNQGWGSRLFSEDPIGGIQDYISEGKAIDEKKAQIAQLTDEINKLRNSTEEVKASSSDIWANNSATEIANAVMQDEELLKNLKEEGRAYEKNSAEAKENGARQKEITEEIVSGKKRLREMGESYDDLKGKIKKAGKEAEKIPPQGNGIKGELQKFAKSYSGGFNFSKLGELAFSATGASIAAVGLAAAGAVKGVKWLTEQAQSLKEALIPLKSYLEEGVLEELRQQLVQLEYDNVHSAEEMAAAGVKFAKYYEGLRANADAMRDMISNSNNFATVLGTTSEKAAEYILKIAGAYHQNALESKQNSTIIINAAKQSTVGVEEMAQAMASSANRASLLGISVKELAAATSYGTSSFGSASAAASAYTMMMDRLTHQSNDKFNPSVVGATKALLNLSKEKNTNAILTELLGKRQATLALSFVKNATEIDNATKALTNHETAEKALAAAESKAENNTKKLENSKKALAHEINLNLTPAFAAILDYLAFFIKSMGEAVTSFKNILSPIATWLSDLDKKFENSAIWQFIKRFGKAFIKGTLKTFTTPVGLTNSLSDTIYKEYKNGQKEEHQENIKKTFADNVQKYGASSLGKAYMETYKTYQSDTGRISKEDKKLLSRLYKQYKTEAKSNTKGTAITFGDDNKIKDKDKEREKEKREKAEKELNEELKALEQKNIDESISLMKDGTDKKIKEIDNDYKKRLNEIKKQEAEFKKKNKEAGKKGNLTDAQSSALTEARKNAEQEYNQKKSEIYKGETDYLQEYLAKYGYFQEQKLAIAMDYAKKIKDVEESGASQSDKDWQIASLRKEQEKETKSVDASSILAKIDMYQLFGNVGDMMKGTLSQLLSDLNKFIDTDKFKEMDVDQQKQIIEAVGSLREKVGTTDVDWKDMAADMQAWQTAVLEAKTASEEYAKLLLEYEPKLLQAQKKLADAKESGDPQAVADAQKEVDSYAEMITSSGEKVKSANDKVITSSRKLAQTTKDVTQPVDEIYTFLSSAGLSQLQDVYGSILQIDGAIKGLKALKEASDAANDVGEATRKMSDDLADAGEEAGDTLAEGLSKAGLIGQIVAAILKILDVLKDGIGTVLESLITSILGAINGILKNILSGQFIEQIVGAIVSGIGNILDTVLGAIGSVVSLGALSSGGPSEWFKNGNAEETEKRRQELTDAAERLTKSIDGLKSELQKQSGIKAISTAKELYETQKQQIENARQQLENENNYHDSHHSNTYYWNTGSFTKDDGGDWNIVTQLLKDYKKKNPNATTETDSAYSYQDLLKLTPEQLDYIRSHDAEQWNAIISVGKYDSSKEKWEALADLAGSLEETLDTLNESLTQISFDSMKDEFISTLMDMDSSAQDFSDKFSEYLMKAVLNAQISNMMEDELNSFYKEWAARAEANGGELAQDDINYLKERWDALVQQGLDIRDQAGAITGYTESQSRQSATSSAIEAITADQASSLIGIGYAMQIALEQGNDMRSAMSIDVASMRTAMETMGYNISEMRDIQFEGLANLQLIAKNTTPIIEMNETMGQMYKLMKERY